MASQQHIDILNMGIKHWNSWREENPDVKPELDKADLTSKDLTGINLKNANLYQANLGFTILKEANLKKANLAWADLTGADVTFADLSWAYIMGANISNVRFNKTTLAGLELSYFENIDRTIHLGPSSISIDSIEMTARAIIRTKEKMVGRFEADPIVGRGAFRYTDRGGDPKRRPYQVKIKDIELFLLSAGIPEQILKVFRLMLDKPKGFYSCFISYSSKDEDFARQLHTDLQNEGIRCWFAPHDLRGGKKIHEQIYSAIQEQDRLLLILSSHSINSEWVKSEIALTRQREIREGKRILFPIRLINFEMLKNWECFDVDTGKDSAREIREFFIPDFSEWQNSKNYNDAFQELLRDLNDTSN